MTRFKVRTETNRTYRQISHTDELLCQYSFPIQINQSL